MTEKRTRKIVRIDEEKCNGCGNCIPSCAEGALRIIDGKARLVSEVYCDGLGACLGNCPQDAISIEERPAAEFDEEAAMAHIAGSDQTAAEGEGCASAAVSELKVLGQTGQAVTSPRTSMLAHWPVQLALVPPNAPFFRDADLLLVGDCVPFSYADFHRDFIKDHAVVVACPKLDDAQAHLDKLTAVLRASDVKSLTVVHMEVPCCSGLLRIARLAIQGSGKNMPLKEVTVSARGDILEPAAR